MIPADYHLHTSLCGHATGKIEDYLEAAARLGIPEVGFSDHLPLYFLPPGKTIPGYSMNLDEIPLYMESVKNSASKHPLNIKIGIEADYVPGHEDTLARLLSSQSFDYVIGSVHFIDGWGFDNLDEIEEYNRRNIDDIYEQYFILLQQASLTGLFDVMAHPDLIKKFGYRPTRNLHSLYEETALAFKKAGVCVEVNSAGLRYPAKEIYPAADMLKILYRHGLPVTLGSDAHCPGQVGAGLVEAVRLLKNVGYKEIALFTGRQKYYTSI